MFDDVCDVVLEYLCIFTVFVERDLLRVRVEGRWFDVECDFFDISYFEIFFMKIEC